MTKQPLISIVITAYNSSKTIEKAINSAFNQTYPNLEIVFVDDCSTDNTIEIIEKFINEHPDFKTQFIKHTKNEGSGKAHNTGHKYAQGEYIMYLDSDDWIDPTFIEDLYNGSEDGTIDIVSGGLEFHHYSGDRTIIIYRDHIEEGVRKVTDHFLTHVPYLVNRIIRRSLFDKFPYCTRRAIDDVTTIFPLLYLANKVRFVESPGYHLTQNPTSVTNSLTNTKDLLFKTLAIRDYIEFFKDKGEEYSSVFNKGHYFNISRELLHNYPQQEILEGSQQWPDEWKEFIDYLKKIESE